MAAEREVFQMRFVFPLIALALVAACVVPEGPAEGPGNVTRVDGNSVVVSFAMGFTPQILTGPSPEQQAEAQRVCDIQGKDANYISYDVRNKEYGAGISAGFYDLLFVCG